MSDTLPDPFDNNLVNNSKPLHSTHEHEEQYRLKIQRFSKVPCEITVQRVSHHHLYDPYHAAFNKGHSRCAIPKKREKNSGVSKPENIERSLFRTKIKARKLATELAPTALVTFTTRAILSVEKLMLVWQRFTRSLAAAGVDFEYLAVPERHPTNPIHLHIHAAYRGRANANFLRRLWHIALEAVEGRIVNKILRGSASPGNIDVVPLFARTAYKRMRKIAKYIAKYITKEVIVEFNKKRYWSSKGIKLEPHQVIWLRSLNMMDALREGLGMMGLINPDGQPCQRIFNPSDRIAWVALDPEKMPEPLF